MCKAYGDGYVFQDPAGIKFLEAVTKDIFDNDQKKLKRWWSMSDVGVGGICRMVGYVEWWDLIG